VHARLESRRRERAALGASLEENTAASRGVGAEATRNRNLRRQLTESLGWVEQLGGSSGQAVSDRTTAQIEALSAAASALKARGAELEDRKEQRLQRAEALDAGTAALELEAARTREALAAVRGTHARLRQRSEQAGARVREREAILSGQRRQLAASLAADDV
jgi:hypothetical protein